MNNQILAERTGRKPDQSLEEASEIITRKNYDSTLSLRLQSYGEAASQTNKTANTMLMYINNPTIYILLYQ